MKLEIDDIVYEVESILKPSNRNIYINLKNNVFVISTPYLLSDKDIEKLYNQNRQVFTKLINRNNKRQTKKTNTIHIFGKEYNVRIIESNKEYCEIDNDTLNIYQAGYGEESISYTVRMFLFKLLENYVKSIEDEAYQDFKDIVKTKPKITFKEVNSYFGKCYYARNEIILNTKLARYDKLYIKSVLYHEYCHFKYHNHQLGFYYLYELKFPNAKRIQHDIREIKYNDLY